MVYFIHTRLWSRDHNHRQETRKQGTTCRSQETVDRQQEAEGGRFVIITAPADETVRPIHDRMPVRIPESLISAWLSDAESAKELLDSATVPLRREQAVEQMSLWEE